MVTLGSYKAFDVKPGDGHVVQFAIAVMSGGLSAQLGGGKFEDGARSAAMGYLFNELQGDGFGKKDKAGMLRPAKGWIIGNDGYWHTIKGAAYLVSFGEYANSQESINDFNFGKTLLINGVSLISGPIGMAAMTYSAYDAYNSNDNIGIGAALTGIVASRIPATNVIGLSSNVKTFIQSSSLSASAFSIEQSLEKTSLIK